MSGVVFENVTKRFGGMTVLESLDLEIADGEFFTLLGPSGCGKTTTLRLIAGLETADTGKIVIGDRDVTRTPPAKRRIAMVFQNYALYPHMTVGENISYPLRLRKTPPSEIEQRVKTAAEKLGISKVLGRLPAEISGGQQQRTAVARAMVQDPRVFLFDEPLSNLDARLRLESRRFLKTVLKDTGGTAVYVTHDQTEAMALSDRVGVMRKGKLVQVAPPAELYLKPASTFVAGFVGNLPMNLVEGRMQDGPSFQSGEFKTALPEGVNAPAGTDVTLGIRPEDTIIGAGDVSGDVIDVEPLGAERIVTVDCSGVELVARETGAKVIRPGDRIDLEIPRDRVHVFGKDGNRIGP